MSMGYWSGAKGQTMRGGNSASPGVISGRQQYVTSAAIRNYTNAGGRFNTAPGSGRPVIPTSTDKWTGETRYAPEFENSLRNTLASFGNEQIGTGMTGRGASERMDIDRALFNDRRTAAIDRYWEEQQRQRIQDQWAQQDADRASDRGWDEEKRAWQRGAWERAKNAMNSLGVGGATTGGSFGVSGLQSGGSK
jgi:hypothetical protein